MKIIETPAEKIFFTSDMHFGHEKLLLFNNRPFKDAKEMDETFVYNWNNEVSKDGLVFVLGDIGETNDARIIEIFDQLQGTKILIRGNHDTIYKEETLKQIFSEIHSLHEIQIFDKQTSKYQEIVLCHYPMFDWNNFHEGSWHLFGHLHTRDLPEFKTLNARLFAQQYDVGVDNNNSTPLSYYQVKEIIERQIKDDSLKQSNYY